MNSERLVSILVFIWFPLSCGALFFTNLEVGGLAVHHFLVFIFYLLAIIISYQMEILRKIDTLVFCFLLYVSITGAFFAGDELSFWLKLGSFIGVILWARLITKSLSLDRFIQILKCSSIFFIMLSMVFILLFKDIASSELQGRTVVNSFYGQKNTYGRFLYMSFFVLLFSKLMGQLSYKMFIILSAIILFLIFLTDSRTSIAVFCLIILLSQVAKFGRLRRLSLLVLSVVAIFFLVSIWSGKIYLDNVGSIYDNINIFGFEVALTGRATIWQSIIENFSTVNFVFGYGLEVFFTEHVDVITNIGLGDFVPHDPHNGYFDLFINLGFIGCVIYFLLVRNYVYNAQSIREKNISIMFVVFIVIFLASNVTESFFVKTSNISSFLFFVFYFYSKGLKSYV